ncbi:MAG: S8/S53 family peptidase [bacterium]
MPKNLITLIIMVLAINYNIFCEIDVSNIFTTSQFNKETIGMSSQPSKLSPLTCKLISTLKELDNKSELMLNTKKSKSFLLKKIDNSIYTGGLIKVNEEFNYETLSNLKVKIGTVAGNIISIQMPINSIEELAKSEGIDYIQIDEPVSKKMDKVRTDINSEKVNSGIDLPAAYKGTGVIVGILDGGFDYTHINFLRQDGSEYRILRVWNQSLIGTAPAGFSYGSELTTTNSILNEQTDFIFESHGTHVAGIAAGSGYNTDGKYQGVAPDADLIFVSLGGSDAEAYNTGQSKILDGINYVFKTAESLGKPAVVNLSLGIHIGPHDGTSLFDEGCDSLVGPGKIIVGSAGNEGDVPLHLSRTFSPSSNLLNTFMYIEPVYWGDEPATGTVDIWGEEGNNFNLVLSLINPQTAERVSSDVISTNENTFETITLTGSDNYDCNISLYVTSSDFNDKPRVFAGIETESWNPVLLTLEANDGTINMWNNGSGGGSPFLSYDVNGVSDGDNNVTVGEIGGTGKSIITVGAYCTKESYTNLDGELVENGNSIDNITLYSSLGPTADGRLKPEVTAPGSYLVSSVNSYDIYMQKGSDYGYFLADESTIDGSYYWYYAGMEGTSMSAPVVVGVVALMLEAKPSLTPEGIKNILKATSRKDSYTGNIPVSGNNTWGYGKIDAYAALNYTVTSVTETNNNFEVTLYPNPASDYFFISSNSDYKINEVLITDILGNAVWSEHNYEQFERINTENLTQNIYFVKLITDKKVISRKLIINR